MDTNAWKNSANSLNEYISSGNNALDTPPLLLIAGLWYSRIRDILTFIHNLMLIWMEIVLVMCKQSLRVCECVEKSRMCRCALEKFGRHTTADVELVVALEGRKEEKGSFEEWIDIPEILLDFFPLFNRTNVLAQRFLRAYCPEGCSQITNHFGLYLITRTKPSGSPLPSSTFESVYYCIIPWNFQNSIKTIILRWKSTFVFCPQRPLIKYLILWNSQLYID